MSSRYVRSTRNYGLRLTFNAEVWSHFLDISSLFYDLELLHDLSLILCVDDYSDYEFPRLFWYRTGRPIKEDQKIQVARIVKGSPLTIELVLAGVTIFSGAFWVLVQAMEKIRNWNIYRKQLKLQVERLKLGNEIKRLELEQKLKERQEASRVLDALIKRLESLPLNLERAEFDWFVKETRKYVDGEELDIDRYSTKEGDRK
jgi:hypothetical protein